MKPLISLLAVLVCLLLTACGGGPVRIIVVPERGPVVEEPTEPVVEEPEKPVVEEPEKPVVEEPEKPVVEEPEKPVVEEPTEPVVTDPFVSPTAPPMSVSSLERRTAPLPKTAAEIAVALQANVNARTGLSRPGWYPFPQSNPPTTPLIRPVIGSSRDFRFKLTAVVDDINRWLPFDRHVKIGGVHIGGLPDVRDVPNGEIIVAESAIPPNPGGKGRASTHVLSAEHGVLRRASTIWVSSKLAPGPQTTEGVLAHELLHALGLPAHYKGDELPDSLLDVYSLLLKHDPIVPDADGLTLLKGYTRLREGFGTTTVSAYDLGPWGKETFSGSLTNCTECAFGTDLIGGHAVPWIMSNDPPLTTLAASGLSGTVTWEGPLAGWAINKQPVGGDVTLDVDLNTMQGKAMFDNLTYQTGSRGQWNDGDLWHPIEVEGNGFRSTFREDPGYTYGRFVGREHQGALGILEHPELTGAFGAVRD